MCTAMAYHLGAGIAMLVTGLAPDIVVVVGGIARAWDKAGPVVAGTDKSRAFAHAAARIISAKPESQLPLQGPVALVRPKHFDSPLIG